MLDCSKHYGELEVFIFKIIVLLQLIFLLCKFFFHQQALSKGSLPAEDKYIHIQNRIIPIHGNSAYSSSMNKKSWHKPAFSL
jgi:hypothetical protein